MGEVDLHSERASRWHVACSLEIAGCVSGVDAGEEDKSLAALHQRTRSLSVEVNVGLRWGGELWCEHGSGIC